MSRNYIAIDNGTTGSIAILSGERSIFVQTPIKKEQNYTKKKGKISRIDVLKLEDLFSENISGIPFCFIERPMVNPRMFQATLSAVRALEATLCVLESMGFAYQYCDSKQWQKAMLPQGVKGKAELKKASMDMGIRLFPQHKEMIIKQTDADSLLMAEYARRNY